MTTVHGVALYVDPDWEPAIITAIDQGPRELSVVRRCADAAELAAAGLSGVADIALIAGDAVDADAHLCDELSAYGMKIVMLRPSTEEADGFSAGYYLSLGADRVVDQHDIDAIIATLSSLIADTPPSAFPASAAPGAQQGIDAEFEQIIGHVDAPLPSLNASNQQSPLLADAPTEQPLEQANTLDSAHISDNAPAHHSPAQDGSGHSMMGPNVPAVSDDGTNTTTNEPVPLRRGVSGHASLSSTDEAQDSAGAMQEGDPVPATTGDAPADPLPAFPEPPSFPTQQRRSFLRGLRRPRGGGPSAQGEPSAQEVPSAQGGAAAVERADSPQVSASEGGEPRGIVVAVFGSSGAPGRTTTTVHVAAELRRHGSTAVLDADVYAPSVAHSLGMAVDGSSVSALARMRGRGLLNPTLLHEAAYDGPGGVKVLTGLTSTHRWREASPTTMGAIVDVCRRTWDYTMVDVHASCGDPVDEYHRSVPHRDHVAAQVLSDADAVLVVVRGDVLGLHRFSETWQWLDLIGAPRHRIVAVNFAQVARAGRAPEQALASALIHEIPGCEISIIPYDGQVLTALLQGRLASMSGKRSARAAFADLAQRIIREVPSARVASMTRRDSL